MEIGSVGFSDSPKTLKFKSYKKLEDDLNKFRDDSFSRHGVDINDAPSGHNTDLDNEKIEIIFSNHPELLSDLLNKSKDEVKIGRIIRKILLSAGKLKDFEDTDIEEFVNILKSEFKKIQDAFDDFELVNGDDIKKYYLCDNYSKESGTLGSSCMKYAEKNEYMNFYGINKDTVSLLIYRGERDAILGKSLIWKGLDESGNTVIFMDRIYTVSDSDVNLFKEYADKKGWIYKDVNNSMESFTFKGEEKTITSKIKNGRYEYYPYLDTLSYYNFEDGLLSNDSGEFEEGSYIELNETDGESQCSEEACGRHSRYKLRIK